jgi:hypothetical protein
MFPLCVDEFKINKEDQPLFNHSSATLQGQAFSPTKILMMLAIDFKKIIAYNLDIINK